ncbi:oligosaccharide flippase family protein [Nitratifractor sp.]
MIKLLFSASFITIVVMGINFVFKIYLSHQIDKSALAIFYTFMDIVGIVLMLFSGFRDTLVKAYDEGLFEKVFAWYIWIILFASCISLVVVAFFYTPLGLDEPFGYFVLITVVNITVTSVSYINTAHKNYKAMLFENFVTTVGLILSYIVLKSFFDGFILLFYSFLASMMVRLIYLLVLRNYTLVFVMSSFDDDIKHFLKNSFYSSLMYFFSGLSISISSIVLLRLYQDANILGDFQVVVKPIFFSLVAIFVFPLNTYLFPEISKLVSKREFQALKRLERVFLKYLLLFFILLLLATFFTKFVISLLFPIDYLQSYKMLNALLPFLPFIAYTTFTLNIIKGANRFDLALLVRIFGSVVFFCSVSLFYLLGYDASFVVLSLDIAFISMALLSFYYKRQIA